MLEAEEIRWIKSTANELNNLLQVIAESSDFLEAICEGTAETDKYFHMLQTAVVRASKVTDIMVERVGGYTASAEPGKAPAVYPPAPVALPKPVSTPIPMPSAQASAARPASAVQPAPRATRIPPSVPVQNPQGPLELIMVVDDEEFVTTLAVRMLSEQGYRVITARDGFQAIDLYRSLGEQISLIVLDFTMPVMDGADVFEELLSINPRVPVVLSSGFAEHERVRGMLARGLRGFIPKPYTKQRLLDQVRATLDSLGASNPSGLDRNIARSA